MSQIKQEILYSFEKPAELMMTLQHWLCSWKDVDSYFLFSQQEQWLPVGLTFHLFLRCYSEAWATTRLEFKMLTSINKGCHQFFWRHCYILESAGLRWHSQRVCLMKRAANPMQAFNLQSRERIRHQQLFNHDDPDSSRHITRIESSPIKSNVHFRTDIRKLYYS